MNNIARKTMYLRPSQKDATTIDGRIREALQRTFFPRSINGEDYQNSLQFAVLWNENVPAFRRTTEELEFLWAQPVKALLRDEILFVNLPEILKVKDAPADGAGDALYHGEWLLYWRAANRLPLTKDPEITKPKLSNEPSTKSGATSATDKSPLQDLGTKFSLGDSALTTNAFFNSKKNICQHIFNIGDDQTMRCTKTAIIHARFCKAHL